ncbi:RNA polymerase factor sigma-54 [Desulfonatronovibrio hydrogenovorans]|uniref:RNA polymerase factor sigma-54 n=1 Tax=Desulfonatronovibrio hydrogenovorans TaxID=53245 RepID=UPI000491F795|nr:RNA polymerase factor sigma-54 [Desulfonatronovibrio hydrogenovorans]
MALELRQNLKLTQQLVMTPQLQQAIKLLQLSRLELLEVVQQELLENPMLEELQPVSEEEQERQALNDKDQGAKLTSEEKEIINNADWEDYLGEFSSTSKQSGSREWEVPEEMQSYEARYSAKPSLEGHLMWQLHLQNLTPDETRIGEEIIGNIDSRGYLKATVEEIGRSCSVQESLVDQVLAKVQNFDPVGVAARDLRECLIIQLKALNETDPILIELVTEHLEDIERNRLAPLLKKFRISKELMKEYIEVLQSLDPFPGSSYGSEDVIYISPDIYVYKYEDDFVIVLNEDGLPSIQLSPFYESLNQAPKDRKNKKEIDYFQEKTRSAIWLMKSLHQRQRTLYKVMESILKFQKEFFVHGVTRLKPLILKEVAEDISMHESTVSRITTSKYVSTPFGLFELKFFFNSALSMDSGGTVGSESVKAAIKKMVASEDPKKPLSDDAIATNLKKELDVNIARRTVAKYRAALKIPSSSRRKKFF